MPHVLIAEDSRAEAEQIKAILQRASYSVTTVSNGVEALQQLQDATPDVLLTDMLMPEMNGLELVNAVKFQHPALPVILMTAVGSDELAVEALKLGAAAYVPKKQLQEALLETIEQVLGLQRADRSYARLLNCLEYNEFRFTLDNDPELIDPLVDLMQQILEGMGLCGPINRVRVGMALEHALLNALYRGNLEIARGDMEKESELLLDGEGSLVAERRGKSPYAERRIKFDARISADQASFEIEDAGPGFDTATLPQPGDPNSLEREAGRGLVLMLSFMDEVTFNARGNAVTMKKRRDKAEGGG